jgi:membrane-associated phospholipid phosphatase
MEINNNTNLKKKIFKSQNSSSFFSKITNFDKKYSEIIHKTEVNIITEFFLFISARLYNPECVLIYFIIMFYYSNFIFILKPLTHVIICLLITILMKHYTKRIRPKLYENIKRRFNVRDREKNCSMPSGDSMQAANFSIIFYCYFGKIFGFFLIIPVMISRIFFCCHYIMDTIVGVIIGFSVSLCLFNFLN